MTRIGIGYDIHRFGGDNPLVLGGILFPGEPGLDGHSDADVVFHAIADALLGAAALGDIGDHFPPGDPKWSNVDSQVILITVRDMLGTRFQITNIDLTLIAERPKIGPARQEMRQSIASSLELDVAQISVKATTNELLGPVGRGEGIACIAAAIIEEIQ